MAGLNERSFGYQEDPKNDTGIIRARTTMRGVRLWRFPRALDALETLHREFEKVAFPGIYILFEGDKKVYVGEAKNIYNRAKQHLSNPPDKIRGWDRILVINDGRPAKQSDFNDNVVRLSLEFYLNDLLKANKYNVLSQAERQTHNPLQDILVRSFAQEITGLLLRQNVVNRPLEEPEQREVFGDELVRILERQGRRIEEWTKYEAIVDGEKYFIRPGSKKPSGWQITFRGRKPGSLIDSFQKGDGHLLVSRDDVLLIPLSVVQQVITDESTYEQDTIDIWIVFSEGQATLRYRDNTIDVTCYKLIGD